jgi:toxin ParE1/3/4
VATHKVIFTPNARLDLIKIYTYVADRSDPIRAANYTKRIKEHCVSLSTFPARGSRRDDLEPGLRVIGFERRVTITFHVEEKSVVIGRILYGGRSLKKAFGSNEE